MKLKPISPIPHLTNIDSSKPCNYMGFLENEKDKSVVAVTGCLHKDTPENKMFITMFSDNSPFDRYFTLDINGKVQSIHPKNDVNKVDNRNGQQNEADEIIDKALEKIVSNAGDVGDFVPDHLTVNLRFGVDKSARSAIENELKMSVDSYLQDLLSHVKAHYQHQSLKHVVTFDVCNFVNKSDIISKFNNIYFLANAEYYHVF